jgi:8-oxo-dGTP pyrophosphatase MutT (NUDIX family)
MNIPALQANRPPDPATRLPFFIGPHEAGSVALAHLEALQVWPQWFTINDSRITLTTPERDTHLAHINQQLHAQGHVRGWRDELYAITDLHTGHTLAHTERAASRFWGTLTLGAHANGYVADTTGRPTHLWIARRSLGKATDPGLFDNLIGGGVAAGQTPRQALVREGFEEAGLSPDQIAAAQARGVLRLHRLVPEGLQLEDLHVFDLPMPPGLVPQNQDGEVMGFECLPVQDAIERALGQHMTVDAALVTLHFAARHGLLIDRSELLHLLTANPGQQPGHNQDTVRRA